MRKLTLFGLLLFSFVISVSHAQTSFTFLGGIHNASVSPNYLIYPDTVKKTYNGRIGVELGVVVNFEIKNGFSFRTGVLFSTKGSKCTQFYDTSNLLQRTFNAPANRKNLRFSEKTVLTTNYVDAPLNLVYSLPLNKKIKFIVGAGPMFSLVYSCYTDIDRLSFSQESNQDPSKIKVQAHAEELFIDLPIGKLPGCVRIAHLGYNGFAGLDFGKISLAINYSHDIKEFFEEAGRNYKHTVIGVTFGVNIPAIGGKGVN